MSQLGWRYAVKKFDATRKIPDATWSALERALVLSPSSYGLQPWRFVVITNPEVKAKLPALSWNQMQPKDCSHFVVFAARKGIQEQDVRNYVDLIMRERGASAESLAGFADTMLGTVRNTPKDKLDIWTSRQAYIALGFFLSACAMLEIDACPMEGIQAPEYDKLLGLEAMGYTAVVGAAAGYRASDDWLAGLKKVRYGAKDVIVRV